MNPREKDARSRPLVVAPAAGEGLADTLAAERAARRDAERENQLKDEFFAALGHELRTPLTAILGWAHILQSSSLSPADTARAVEVIVRNAKLQASVIDDMLDLSRIMTGKLRLSPVTLCAARALDLVFESAHPAAATKGVLLQKDTQGSPAFVLGDPDRVQQILWNLVANAIKFTPPGGTVRLSCFRADDFVVWEVSDSGRGIAPEHLPDVFERFRQVDSGRSSKGLGLGLSIARHLVEMHGGHITATSDGLGRGATFSVRLPATTPSSEEAPMQSAVAPTAAVSGLLRGAAVLVVDDDPDARELLNVLLAESGAKPFVVPSAEEARAVLSHRRVDVIVCDVEMPDEDGYTFMRALRASGEAAGAFTPALALTAHASEQHARESLLAGFQMYAPKPIDPPTLLRELARLWRRGPISIQHE